MAGGSIPSTPRDGCPIPRQSRAAQHRALLNEHRPHYEGLLKFQGGGCATCGRPPVNRKLDMDHDHKSMEVRGLLCVRCNRTLPDWVTPELLRAMADYLENPPYPRYRATLGT